MNTVDAVIYARRHAQLYCFFLRLYIHDGTVLTYIFSCVNILPSRFFAHKSLALGHQLSFLPLFTCNMQSYFSAANLLGQPLASWLDEWRFQPNVTPGSSWPWPASFVFMYFATIFILKRIMVSRKPLHIPYILFLHNMLLCLSSLFLAIWLSYSLVSALVLGLTPYQLLCSRAIYENGHLHMIYYINMMFKVWEFQDTFLLVLRKKHVAFLHAYHHAATLLLTWNQMMEHSAPQWVAIVINLWVHVVMYYYYAMSALSIRVWWKKYLTKFQIAQFFIDVVVIGYAYYCFAASGMDENVCYGTSRGGQFGLLILTSYLILFVRFYVQTYSASLKDKSPAIQPSQPSIASSSSVAPEPKKDL